jgi:hypothetical protein
VPEEYVRWVKLMYHETTSSVRCSAGITERFGIRVGVHQGSALSPLLFILCMDTATGEIQTPHPWTLLYADDVMLAHESRVELERLVGAWRSRLEDFGMRLNLSKTEYMECGTQTGASIVVDGVTLTKTTDFRYLGARIASDADTSLDARARVNAAWLKWRQVAGVLCDRRIPLRLKTRIYETVVRPVALYGSECWPVTGKHERMLHAMEMRMLRWAHGVTRLDHIRNDEIRQAFKVAPIQQKMREARLRWFGHVARASGDSVAGRALEINPEGRRRRGRPRKRWQDCLREDMRVVGLRPEDAADRDRWRAGCRMAYPR